MTEKEIVDQLLSSGAIIQNTHVIYTSGRHGDTYINKDALYPHTQLTSEIAHQMALPFKEQEIQAVVAPALGGIVLSQWLAYHLSTLSHREVLAVYAEKTPDERGFVLRRGHDRLISGRRVLIAEDIITTGGSVAKVIESVRMCGGLVAGVCALCNRGNVSSKDLFGLPVTSLLNLNLESWKPEECPLCKKNIPFNESVGKASRPLSKI